MSSAIDEIRDELNCDMVSHCWVEHFLAMELETAPNTSQVRAVLTELLASGKVEIGTTNAIPNYVEFIAWKGGVESRVDRALAEVNAAVPFDKGFAYWLCWSRNVDRFEE